MTRHLKTLTLGLVLLMPWFLLHARAGAELGIDLVGACFLARCAAARSWGWLRQDWVVIGLAWWGWLVACTAWNLSLPGQDGAAVLQALLVLRFLLFVAAMEHWTLADPSARRWFFVSLVASTLYVAAQTLLQFATGHNLYGVPRSEDGELTGPFSKPRAAPSFVRMLFPALLPAADALLARPGWLPRLGGAALFAGGNAVVVLIGQRMPVLLAALGLLATALLLPRLRGPAAVAIVAGGALIAASAVVSPPVFYRLVTKFSRQVGDFADSPYGQIAERAVAIAEQHPLTGRGYDGFRTGCPQPRYFQGWHWPGDAAPDDGGGAAVCVTHPHNHYLQALTDAGLPGLLLFCALVGTWLWRLGRGLLRAPDPLRVGLFIAALLQEWPVASTSPLISLPIGGWFFLLLGFGLAEARSAAAVPRPVLAQDVPDRLHDPLHT